jgi:hypothetical protein
MILGEYQKIQRTKVKFKSEFKNCMVHMNGRDYVIKHLVGDIDY